MLPTNAYVYLNVDDPICARCAVRGTLVSAGAASSDPGFVSMMAVSLMKNDRAPRFANEMIIELVRRARYPHMVSRLTGLYCFLDLDPAERAAALWSVWHIRPANLVEV